VLRKGLIGYLPANIVQGLVGLFSITVFTRVLTPEAYGCYALAFSAMALCQTSVFTWLEASMARFWPLETHGGEPAALIATIYRAFWRTAAGFVLVAALAVWLWPADASLKWALAAGLSAVVARSSIKLALERRRAAVEAGKASLLDIAQTAGGFALGAGFALAGLGACAPLWGLGLAALLCIPFALPGELRRGRGAKADPGRLKGYAAYGFPVSASLILSLGLATTDRFLIGAMLDPKSVGAYHAAYTLANRTLEVIFVWLGAAGVPALVMALERGGQAGLERAARGHAGFMVLLTLPASVGLMLTAQPLADVMVGQGLRAEAARVTPLIALSALFSGVTVFYFHQAFILARRTRRLLLAMAIPAAANVVLNLALIPLLGLVGAAWAAVLSYGLGALSSWALGRTAQPLPIPWGTLARCGLSAAAMVPAVLAVPAAGGLPELLAKAFIGGLVYGLGVLAFDAGGARSEASRLFKGFLANRTA
jgi:O-antigen/teichoic acid export membrane protein